MIQQQPQSTGYVSTEVMDIHDPSVFLSKEVFLLTQAQADLMSSLWFPDENSYTPKARNNIYLQYKNTTQLFYALYLFTVQHFRKTIDYKLAPEELAEIKQTVEVCDGFFKDLNGLLWENIPKKEVNERIVGLNTLIMAYLQILNIIKLHRIGSMHQYTDPKSAYRGSGAI